MTPTLEQVISVVCSTGGLSALDPDDDIFAKGFSSVAALQLLLELEAAFAVAIPDDAFMKRRTARGLAALVEALKGGHTA